MTKRERDLNLDSFSGTGFSNFIQKRGIRINKQENKLRNEKESQFS
jgi:hypothetical protein